MRRREFNRQVAVIRMYFNRKEAFEQLREMFLQYTEGRRGRLRMYTSTTLEDLVETAIDFSDLAPADIMDVLSISLQRWESGEKFPDIVLFMDQFFDLEFEDE